MSEPKQLALDFTPPIAFPLSPRAAGRLAARRRANVLTCPHPEGSWAWEEWRAGWGLVWGIPDTAEGRAEYLRVEFLRLWGALTEVRDNPEVPQYVRDRADRHLTLDKSAREDMTALEG